jgi:t-SNARE complex subunit (syntaxin)
VYKQLTDFIQAICQLEAEKAQMEEQFRANIGMAGPEATDRTVVAAHDHRNIESGQAAAGE